MLGAPEGALDAAETPPPIAAVDIGAKGGALPSDEALDDDATALVVYTSGTTGLPKGVLMPRRAIASNLDALADAWELDGRRTVSSTRLPLFHVHGLVLGTVGAAARRRAPASTSCASSRGGRRGARARRDDALRRADDVRRLAEDAEERPDDRRRPAPRAAARVRLRARCRPRSTRHRAR